MADRVTLGKTEDVPAGEVRSYDANGVTVAVANVDGTLYAFDDTCPHRQCSLAEGDLEETTVICACHGSEFDVRTGALLNGPAEDPVAHYEVSVENGEIQIELS